MYLGLEIGCYNGAFGPFCATENVWFAQPPLPPPTHTHTHTQRKGRLPQYAYGRLVELQGTFDALESNGILVKPEVADSTVEYVNPSLLVK